MSMLRLAIVMVDYCEARHYSLLIFGLDADWRMARDCRYDSKTNGCRLNMKLSWQPAPAFIYLQQIQLSQQKNWNRLPLSLDRSSERSIQTLKHCMFLAVSTKQGTENYFFVFCVSC
mmetsp:Transcript_6349/g.13989  ORF Transcript_6349/g.13989 Transcript_6349/m.13989 type:complete len:117 (-) Transcript_6349:70-420(-)